MKKLVAGLEMGRMTSVRSYLGSFFSSASNVSFEFLKVFAVFLLLEGVARGATYSENSTNSTLAGTEVEHRLRWQDGVGLSGYVFSFCNGTYAGPKIYNWTSTDQEADVKRFNTTSGSSVTQKIKRYNTTLGPNIVKAYGVSVDTNYVTTSSTKNFGSATAPTFAETFGAPPYNFTQLGYERIASSDNAYANLTSNANNLEPFGIYNFTIQEDKSTINWIYIELEQSEATAGSTGTGEYCYYGVANWSASNWFQFGTYVNGQTDTTRTYNFSTPQLINQFVDGNNVLSMINWGANMDANEGCRIDFVQVTVNYNETSYSPSYEQDSTFYVYDGIDGDDYQNVDKVGVIITIDSYNPSASNSTYNNNNRPDIEVGIWNGSQHVTGFYCQASNTMGSEQLNTTDWNCSVSTTDSAIRNAWKTASNRKVEIRGVYMDAYNSTIYDEINVTGVYSYVNAWNTTSGLCSDPDAILTNDSWVAFASGMCSTPYTDCWSNVTKLVNSTVGAFIKWCVYVNDTSNNWYSSCSPPYNYTTTSLKKLLVSWHTASIVNSTVCTAGTPCQYNRYENFTANATVQCSTIPPSLSCGSVTGSIRYNSTGGTPDTLISTTPGATPFFTDTNPNSCGSLSDTDSCTLNWKVNVSGVGPQTRAVDVNFSSNDSAVPENNTDDAYISVAEAVVGFTITLPSQNPVYAAEGGNATADIEFNLTGGNTASNVVPCIALTLTCQEDGIPIFQFINTGTATLDWYIYLDTALPASITLKGDTDNNPSGATQITTSGWLVASGIAPTGSKDVWLWTDFNGASVSDATSRYLINNATVT
ncbi:MAG: hypothetical protein QXF56_05410 [Candidatus Micrarchaeia archaeon]